MSEDGLQPNITSQLAKEGESVTCADQCIRLLDSARVL